MIDEFERKGYTRTVDGNKIVYTKEDNTETNEGLNKHFGGIEEFQNEMKGIYTTCVVPDTLDESPMAYKSIEEIVSQVGPTAIIVERIRPVYNFKASD